MVERAAVQAARGRQRATSDDARPAATAWVGRLVAFGRSFPSFGVAGGLLAFCLSMFPSLIPRAWLAQAVFSGLTVTIGYALGVLLRWFGRRAGIHPDWSPTTRRVGRLVVAAAGLVAVVAATVFGASWQSELRGMFGMPGVEIAFVAVPLVAAAIALILVLLGRVARRGARLLSSVLTRWLSRTAAHVAGAVGAVVLAVLLFNGTIMAWTVTILEGFAASVEERDAPGVVQPSSPARSGSPASLVSWESLGANGRAFVSGGPSSVARVPVRIYAGLDSAASLDQSAQLVVAELDRTGAWDRDVLLVVTPSGDGRISSAAIATLELMYDGDTATASMQYSYVPSWLSFLADRNTAPEAGQELFEAVYAAWSERPEADRPRLLVFGESLGSYGGHGAFSGLQDMVARTDGALWVATPSFTDIWRELTDARDPVSPEIAPVYDGGHQVRWGTGSGAETGIWDAGPAWERPRVVYLQHPSDGVVWWSSDLALHRPDWLREPSGHDVLPDLPWLPLVTFWLATMDMVIAEEVPPGHGHVYLREYAEAWAAVAAPEGWTDDDTALLRSVVAEQHGDS